MILTRVEYNIIMAVNDYDNFLYRLSTKIDVTYSHVVKVVDKLETLEILESKHSGRKRILKLTEKGLKVKNLLLEIRSTLNLGEWNE